MLLLLFSLLVAVVVVVIMVVVVVVVVIVLYSFFSHFDARTKTTKKSDPWGGGDAIRRVCRVCVCVEICDNFTILI